MPVHKIRSTKAVHDRHGAEVRLKGVVFLAGGKAQEVELEEGEAELLEEQGWKIGEEVEEEVHKTTTKKK